MSFGWGSFSQAVATAAQEAYDAGDLLVGLAGNVSQTGSTVSYPGRYSSVIAVSGLNADDTFWNGSASGPEVELSAPACVQTLEGVSGTKVVCGTSYAAPAASGVAALVWSENPGWTNTQVRSWLQSSALDLGITGRDNQFGYGRVDACRAVVGGCIPLPPPPLNIQIVGPDEIEPTSTCTWEAHPLNGTPPFSYYWSGQIQPQGTNSPYYTGGMDPAQSGSTFTIRVDVSDSAGSSGWANLAIAEDPLAPACVQFAQQTWSVR